MSTPSSPPAPSNSAVGEHIRLLDRLMRRVKPGQTLVLMQMYGLCCEGVGIDRLWRNNKYATLETAAEETIVKLFGSVQHLRQYIDARPRGRIDVDCIGKGA